MCKYVKYMVRYRSCKKDHSNTMREITEECDDPLKGLFCPNAIEDTTRIYGSVSKAGACPLCPPEPSQQTVRDAINHTCPVSNLRPGHEVARALLRTADLRHVQR